MVMKILTIVAACVASGLLTACVQPTPYLDEHYGEAYRMAVAHQTINPDAAQNRNPVNGVDGVTARNVMQTYQNTSKEPPPSTNIFNIGIGSGHRSIRLRQFDRASEGKG